MRDELRHSATNESGPLCFDVLLDNDKRDNGKIWVDIPQSIVSELGRLLKGVGGSVTILISSSSSSNIPISPANKVLISNFLLRNPPTPNGSSEKAATVTFPNKEVK